jgi:two-component system nitrogen regulation response regulator NtrX
MVIMISGHADIDTAVSAIRLGAHDFIEKPLSLDRVLITIDNANRTFQLRSEKDRLASRVYGEIVGQSNAIKAIKDQIVRSAPRTSRFLITGESGTGKELVAMMIHQFGRNSEGPFVAVNCAALPAELVESELFGHVAGAFTGAKKTRKGRFVEAQGGSIFLDEISEMPLDAQAKILRTLETNQVQPVGSDQSIEVSLNIIAASNRNLLERVEEGKFRQDLLYRLNVVEIEVPPLRDRGQDIILLAEYFLARFAQETGSVVKKLTANAMAALKRYPFPGNARELKNLMERASIYIEGDRIDEDVLVGLLPVQSGETSQSLKDAVASFEYRYLKQAIADSDGNITEAARRLGVERSHLYKKLRKYEDREE